MKDDVVIVAKNVGHIVGTDGIRRGENRQLKVLSRFRQPEIAQRAIGEIAARAPDLAAFGQIEIRVTAIDRGTIRDCGVAGQVQPDTASHLLHCAVFNRHASTARVDSNAVLA